MAILFTSDTHFGHANIIEYSSRPFASVDAMDAQLILNWNRVVKPQDEVYHLGDIFLCNAGKASSIRQQLNGRIYLILGNHDKNIDKLPGAFVWTKDYYRLKIQDPSAPDGRQEVVLLHYAMRVWSKSHHGSFHAYGHSHGELSDDPYSLSMDVGVDSIAKLNGKTPDSYRPVTYEEFKSLLLKKTKKKTIWDKPVG